MPVEKRWAKSADMAVRNAAVFILSKPQPV